MKNATASVECQREKIIPCIIFYVTNKETLNLFGMLGVNLPMFLVSLSRSFRSKPCDDLRLTAADSFGLLTWVLSHEACYVVLQLVLCLIFECFSSLREARTTEHVGHWEDLETWLSIATLSHVSRSSQ